MLTLKDVANYIMTRQAPKGLLALLRTCKRIFNFAQERANRIARAIAITREYGRGTPVKEIEQKYQCSRSTILRYARAANLPKRPKHFHEEIKKQVLQDYKAGVPIAVIAQTHGVSQAYVSKMATEAGISRYKKGKSR